MATTFLEPGGDATFNVALTTAGGFWATKNGSPDVATDFVHGSHIKSITYPKNSNSLITPTSGLVEAASRISVYFYFNALPGATAIIFQGAGGGFSDFSVRVTSGGVLQIWSGSSGTPAQIGTNGSTLSAGQWYRISLAYTLTNTTTNRFELFVNGASSISITNATINSLVGINTLQIGNISGDTTLDLRSSDHYIDNSNALTDTGDIWVTAKRPNANGTTNGFTTQIGAGGSGYGTGHSPQVNERALSTTNGWSMIGAGSAITEEYTIEGQSTGDISTSGGTIIDFVGWVYASAALSETGSIIVAGSSSNISLTSTNTMFTKVAGSTSYPSGATDIGIITSTTVTTVSLYECGIILAFIPPPQPLPSVSDSSAMSDIFTIQEVDLIDEELIKVQGVKILY